MEDTEIRNNDADQGMTLTEVLAVVIYKIANRIPMTTAREELCEEFLLTWADSFGYETAR